MCAFGIFVLWSNRICNSSRENIETSKMSHTIGAGTLGDGVQACNTHLIESVDALSMNRHIPAHQFPACSAAAHNGVRAHRNGSFVNGDLIDLGDQADRDHLSESSRHLVEAINSQLLAEINGKSQAIRDCSVLYPTKVSFDNTISGMQLNYVAQLELDNSSDLSRSGAAPTAARSSETIGRCSESSGTANEQHHTVIREFKRLGTYCTLRPEQRRKHLLKVLPTLRNSMLLQTLFASNSNASTNLGAADELDSNKDIDSLLIDLDDFIIDGNTALMHRRCNGHFDSSESFTSNCDSRSQRSYIDGAATSIASSGYTVASNEMANNCINIDPDKVEDCLLELDAYLEEIDRDYVLACAANGPTTSTLSLSSAPTSPAATLHNTAALNYTKSAAINANIVTDSLEKTSKNHIDHLFMNHLVDGSTSSQANRLMDRLSAAINVSNLRKPISNSDIQMNQCGQSDGSATNGSRNTDNQRKFNDSACEQPLKRGHKLRNTVAVSGRSNQAIASNAAAASQSGKMNEPISLSYVRLLCLRLRKRFVAIDYSLWLKNTWPAWYCFVIKHCDSFLHQNDCVFLFVWLLITRFEVAGMQSNFQSLLDFGKLNQFRYGPCEPRKFD